MDELQRLISQLKDFSSNPHSKLQTCADIMRFLRKSNTPKLKELAIDCEDGIDSFTKDLIQKITDEINNMSGQIVPEYSLEPSGLLSGISKKKSSLNKTEINKTANIFEDTKKKALEQLFYMRDKVLDSFSWTAKLTKINDDRHLESLMSEAHKAVTKLIAAIVATDGSIDVTLDDLRVMDTLASMAAELDKTGDPELIKEASVLDEILLTLAAPKDARAAFKLAEDKEIERLREKYRSESLDHSYKMPREELEKDMKTADAIKAIDSSIKEYRPLEAPLSTRTCPDHPGAQIARIADSVYQCSLDKKIYNYQGGFTTMKGNKIPGGDVASQTQSLGDRAIEHMSFDSRESKLNG